MSRRSPHPAGALVNGASAGDDGVSATVHVHGIGDMNEEMLELLFESRRRSGGGPITSIVVHASQGLAEITFEDPQVAERVLTQRVVKYNGKTLTVVRPPEPDPYSVLVTGLAPTTSRDFLEMYFELEKRSGGGPVQSIDFTEGSTVACITFQDKAVASRVLKHSPQTLNGSVLTVQPLPKPKHIQVCGVGRGSQIDQQMLELYFENPRSGGGVVSQCELHRNNAIIKFEDPAVIPDVLSHKHTLKGQDLTVKSYYPELTVNHADNSSLATAPPGPLGILVQHNDIITLLRNSSNAKRWLDNQQQSHHFVIDWGASSGKNLSLVYSANKDDPRTSEQWETETQEHVMELLGCIIIINVSMDTEFYNIVESKVKALTQNNDSVIVNFDQSLKIAQLIGFRDEALATQKGIEDIVKQVKEENSSKTIQNEFPLPKAQLDLLEKSKHVEYMKGRLPNLEIRIENCSVVFQGVEEDVTKGVSILFDDFLDNLVVREFSSVDSRFSVMKNAEMAQVVHDLIQEEGLLVVLDTESESNYVSVLGLSEQDISATKDLIDRSIVEKLVTFPSSDILSSALWKQTRDDLLQVHIKSLVIEENSAQNQVKFIYRTELTAVVEDAIGNLDDINSDEKIIQMAMATMFLTHTQCQDKLTEIQTELQAAYPGVDTTITPCDPTQVSGFTIKGCPESIRAASIKLQSVVAQVTRDDIIITTPSMPVYFLSSEGETFLSAIEKSNQAVCVVDDNTDRLLSAFSAVPQSPVSPISPGSSLGAPLFPGSPSTGGSTVTVITLENGVTIKVLKRDLRTAAVDVIVIPASQKLEHVLPSAKAIIQQAGPTIVKECLDQVNLRTHHRINLATPCITMSGKLRCKRLLHLVAESGDLLKTDDFLVQEGIAACLEDIKYQENMSSVAFLLLEKTGPWNRSNVKAKTLGIARSVLAFLAFDPRNEVKEVELVCTNPEMNKLLKDALLQVISDIGVVTQSVEDKDVSTELIGAVGGISGPDLDSDDGIGAAAAAGDTSTIALPDVIPDTVTISVFALTKVSVDKVIQTIQRMCKHLTSSVMFGNEEEQLQIAELTQDQYGRIKDLQNEFAPYVIMSIKREEHLNCIEVSGRAQKVKDCDARIIRILSSAWDDDLSEVYMLTPRDEAVKDCEARISRILSSAWDDDLSEAYAAGGAVGGADASMDVLENVEAGKIVWERQVSQGCFEPIPQDIAVVLELAFQQQQGSAEYEGGDGLRYRVDFRTMKQHKLSGDKTIVGIRRKGGSQAPPRWSYPSTWEAMGPGERCKVTELVRGEEEYIEVLDTFRVTCSSYTLVKIERIQNPTLWQQYQVKKQQMEETNEADVVNERRLFHGTADTTVPHINAGGFNRSYCGKNATMFGKGVYFAKEASYSARVNYSPPGRNSHRHIYYSRVLTGAFVEGRNHFLEPPARDANNPTLKYDSVVDSTSNPEIFVIFHDTQAYPEYLITFTG